MMSLWSLLFDSLKDITEDYINSVKNCILDISKKVYVFTVISIISILMVCFSFASLLIKFAEKLDSESSFTWQNSMTLYSLVFITFLGILYYVLNRHERYRTPSLEKEIEDVVQKHMKKSRKRKSYARNSRPE